MSILPNKDSKEDTYILSEFSKIITSDDLVDISKLCGFNDPNNFSSQNLNTLLVSRKFPNKNHFEYAFAIGESVHDYDFQSLSDNTFMYLATVFIYCNKIRTSCMDILESNFYYWVLERSKKLKQDDKASILFSLFLEWLYDFVSGHEGYDDYFSIITWLFLQRIIQQCDQPQFEKMVSVLSKKDYSSKSIELLVYGTEEVKKWVVLNDELPEAFSYNREFFRKILQPDNGKTVINNADL